jgi:hypothetical protein
MPKSTRNVNGWTEEKIVNLLKTSDKAIEKALVRLYQRQTASEQCSQSTHVHNGVGFKPTDAEFFSSLAQRVMAGRPARDAAPGCILSPKQIYHCRKGTKSNPDMPRLGVYRKQLLDIIAEDATKPTQSTPAAPAPIPAAQPEPAAVLFPLGTVDNGSVDIGQDAAHFGIAPSEWLARIAQMDETEYRNYVAKLESANPYSRAS